VGPAEALFEMPFYRDLHRALRPGGRVCTQAETLWVHLPLIETMLRGASALFTHVEYCTTQIPSYPCGMIGFLCCTKANDTDKKDEKTKETCSSLSYLNPSRLNARPQDVKKMALRYYTADMHRAAVVLPKVAEDALLPTLHGKQRVRVPSLSDDAAAAAKKQEANAAKSSKLRLMRVCSATLLVGAIASFAYYWTTAREPRKSKAQR
jgi:hypothetical protein